MVQPYPFTEAVEALAAERWQSEWLAVLDVPRTRCTVVATARPSSQRSISWAYPPNYCCPSHRIFTQFALSFPQRGVEQHLLKPLSPQRAQRTPQVRHVHLAANFGSASVQWPQQAAGQPGVDTKMWALLRSQGANSVSCHMPDLILISRAMSRL